MEHLTHQAVPMIKSMLIFRNAWLKYLCVSPLNPLPFFNEDKLDKQLSGHMMSSSSLTASESPEVTIKHLDQVDQGLIDRQTTVQVVVCLSISFFFNDRHLTESSESCLDMGSTFWKQITCSTLTGPRNSLAY